MDNSIYDNLPEDPELAFAELESHFRAARDASISRADSGNEIFEIKKFYCNYVLSAAKALNVEHIRDLYPPTSEKDWWEFFNIFDMDVMNIVIQIRIYNSRRQKQYSVALNISAKQKIRHYIEQIRTAVENSNISQDKRDAIFKRLAELTLEIDRDRTRFEIVTEGIRGLAQLSGDVEREAAEPWWKWVRLIFGAIDDSKEKEPQTSLPAPESRKRLESPRKQLPPPNSKTTGSELNDEIPF